MPGIAGIISSRPAAGCERVVTAMLATMRHERFYESGTCSAEEMGVYAGWTAHPRSFASRQSVASGPPHLTTVLSGDCVGTAAETDLAVAYLERGDDFVRELN